MTMWICKHSEECNEKDCVRSCLARYTFILEHIRYRFVNRRANWYRINCFNSKLSDSSGQSIAVRWKGNK